MRQIRIVCGLVLFGYLLSHYINHALGNISLDAMEYGLRFHAMFWHSPIGTLLLYPALGVHASLGLWALYQRRYFRWKTAEVVQLLLGLSIPALLCTHLIGERLGVTLYGLQRSYALALYNFWIARPDLGMMQAAVLLIAWIYGCIGVYFWLRLKPSFPKTAPVLFGLAVLLPVLALLGSYQQGKAVKLLAQQPAWRTGLMAPARTGTAAERDNLDRLRDYFLWFTPERSSGVRGPRHSPLQRAAARHDPPDLPGPDDPGAEGPVGPRSELPTSRAARQRLRRQRPLLNLPDLHRW